MAYSGTPYEQVRADRCTTVRDAGQGFPGQAQPAGLLGATDAWSGEHVLLWRTEAGAMWHTLAQTIGLPLFCQPRRALRMPPEIHHV